MMTSVTDSLLDNLMHRLLTPAMAPITAGVAFRRFRRLSRLDLRLWRLLGILYCILLQFVQHQQEDPQCRRCHLNAQRWLAPRRSKTADA
ncbi:hypothetical protein ACLB2K_001217 [Fragaria x ananassa]